MVLCYWREEVNYVNEVCVAYLGCKEITEEREFYTKLQSDLDANSLSLLHTSSKIADKYRKVKMQTHIKAKNGIYHTWAVHIYFF